VHDYRLGFRMLVKYPGLTLAGGRPRVLAYGGESPGDRSWLEFLVTHGPILLVLIVACVNVGTLIYARTATRDADSAQRGAQRSVSSTSAALRARS
jgi:hypothetical protein